MSPAGEDLVCLVNLAQRRRHRHLVRSLVLLRRMTPYPTLLILVDLPQTVVEEVRGVVGYHRMPMMGCLA